MLSTIVFAAALSSASLAPDVMTSAVESAPKPVREKVLLDEFARSLTIEIESASANPVDLGYAELTGGVWEQTPIPGSTVEPGDVVSYRNGVDNQYDALGGMIRLLLPFGDSILIEFEWGFGSDASCTANGTNLQAVTVSSELEYTMSANPVCTITILNGPGGD